MCSTLPTAPGDSAPSRYLAGLMVRELVEFVGKSSAILGVDITDALIVGFVGWNSIKDMVDERYLSSRYGFEEHVLPTDERPGTSIREICAALGLTRETVRRRLIAVTESGLLLKTDRGFVLPAQTGEDDRTREVRRMLSHNMERLLRDVERIRGIHHMSGAG